MRSSRTAIDVTFPTAGVMRRHSFQAVPPYTCYDALNVIPDDPFLERERGGSRPGSETLFSGSGRVDHIGSVGYRNSDGDLKREILIARNGMVTRYEPNGKSLGDAGTGLADDGITTGTELSGKYYFAGANTDARTPYVLDPKQDTFAALEATTGTLPQGCRIMARYRNRLVLCSNIDNANNVYMSRIGDPTDWNYGASDAGAAVNFINSDAGVVGSPVTAAIEHTDSCMIFGCTDAIWILRADPAQGGYIELLSHEVGILSHQSYCYSPDGYLWIMTTEGLYGMAGSCGGPFFSVSREKIPQELRGIDPEEYHVSMVYDQGLRGLLIFVTKRNNGITNIDNNPSAGSIIIYGPDTPTGGDPPVGGQLITNHFFVDIRNTVGGDMTHRSTASFWPLTFSYGDEPTCAENLSGGVGPYGYGLMGTRTGKVKRFNTTLENDGSGRNTSYVMLGPIMLGDAFNEGALCELTATLAFNSDPVEFDVYVADTPEEALQLEKPSYSGEWTAGPNRTYYPRLRGRAAYIVVRAKKERWSLEGITVVREKLGRRRNRTKQLRNTNSAGGEGPVY